MEGVDKIAFRLFGGYFKAKRESVLLFLLRKNLLKARIFVPTEKWLSKAVFYSLLGTALVLLIFLLIKFLLSLDFILSFIPLLYRPFSFGLTDFVLLLAVILVAFCSVFCGFYFLPNITAWERKKKIETTLPYAISYISSMAAIGVIPYDIFKKLSEVSEIYGEVSVEASYVVRDVELLGYDFMTALKNLASATPSEKMQSFVQGAVTTALSGGEMGYYFINTAKEYMAGRRKKYKELLATLGLLAELYVTGLVVAPLLLIVVLSIMLFIQGIPLSWLEAIVYVFIPLGSGLFILFLDILFSDLHK